MVPHATHNAGVVIALVIGFPIAMILAWVYEFTPEGVVRTEDLRPAQAKSAQRVTGRILDFIIIGVLLLIIVLLIVGRFPLHRQTGEWIAEKSIAVLPFDNAYFAVDVQDEGNKMAHWRGLPGVMRRRRANERGLVSSRDVMPMDPQEVTRVR